MDHQPPSFSYSLNACSAQHTLIYQHILVLAFVLGLFGIHYVQ
jgi:hypothetical protein